jgi:hypothetical protein
MKEPGKNFRLIKLKEQEEVAARKARREAAAAGDSQYMRKSSIKSESKFVDKFKTNTPDPATTTKI